MPAKAPASTCQGGPSVTEATAAVPPLAATVAAVMRPLLKPATRPMNSAVKAKSAPKRLGSPRKAPITAHDGGADPDARQHGGAGEPIGGRDGALHRAPLGERPRLVSQEEEAEIALREG